MRGGKNEVATYLPNYALEDPDGALPCPSIASTGWKYPLRNDSGAGGKNSVLLPVFR